MTHPGFPEIKGRVSRLKDGRIGRFGWKAQTPSLRDFVLTACAVELGLEVPGHHQGGSPQRPDAKAKGLDLTDQECSALIKYVRALPPPREVRPATTDGVEHIKAGKAFFTRVGCATCHTPRLGHVEGIYSDLLLHDLGPELGDVGQYEVFDPNSSESEDEDFDDPGPSASGKPAPSPATKTGPASRFEWRTPPLWGFRDSGPYLHDGRAGTLEQAVALHGGEATQAARAFFALKPQERQQLEAFLKSLTAPIEPERLAHAGK
jgi:CxxC motif-containing protein (DUF1111 family)